MKVVVLCVLLLASSSLWAQRESCSLFVLTADAAELTTAINASATLNIRSSAESPFSVELEEQGRAGTVAMKGAHWRMSAEQRAALVAILDAKGWGRNTRAGSRVWFDCGGSANRNFVADANDDTRKPFQMVVKDPADPPR